ncbi:hypothetical protein [Chryseobacterium sp.]|uniref:hypothetical protein n=2 Tax=Chryseobacterium TaxID=59732 RepID=UPI000EBA5D9E|nr:hypothetical protein [Chryseobacterium sp.]HCM34759.1 hypothetical protein [Chryseobacterium sp.]
MKYSIKLLFLVFFILTFNKVNAQLDTMKYIKQFEANKSQYVNKPFSFLLGQMTQIQPRTAWSISSGRKKASSGTTRFKFASKEASFHNAITLLIYWQEEIPRDQTKYYEQKNQFYFTNDERTFFGDKIVKDIVVYR